MITATVIGATYHYSLLWAVVLCIPFLITLFAVTARIGHDTRKGLVELLRVNYGKPLAVVCAALVVVINLAMIVADMMAVTDGLSIILDQKRRLFVAVVGFTVWFVLIFRDYKRITHALAWFSLPVFAYVAAAVMSGPSPRVLVENTIVPRIAAEPGYAFALVALFGSLLTPYLLVWQTSSRRDNAIGGGRITGFESHFGGWITAVLAYAIIVASATVLHGAGADLTTRQAAQALGPAFGSLGPILFALAIVASGMVALPVLVATMCYSVAEALEWKYGLSEFPWEAKRFYVLISAAMFLAAASNLLTINPVRALYWSQLLAGILTLPILIFILLVSNDRRVMSATNSRGENFWIGAAAGAIAAAILLAVVWKAHG
jgi:Mn2+/Fe2+ NRAMP family transporter